MSADFWAGYLSGAIGILIGNPLDLIKTRLQAHGKKSSNPSTVSTTSSLPGSAHSTTSISSSTSTAVISRTTPHSSRWTCWARGAAAPILGYGALNALLFVTYNRTLSLLTTGNLQQQPRPDGLGTTAVATWWRLWAAGAAGGLATFVVSAPTELVKCRAQVSGGDAKTSGSVAVAREIWNRAGLRGLYLGGGVTSLRDAVGYGFYFWSYELSKRALTRDGQASGTSEEAIKVLFCGGLAGVVTWASIFPLDVIKTRVQTWDLLHSQQHSCRSPLASEEQALLHPRDRTGGNPGAVRIAIEAYRNEGMSIFFRGLGVCSARAFLVNAVQWAVYEWTMKALVGA